MASTGTHTHYRQRKSVRSYPNKQQLQRQLKTMRNPFRCIAELEASDPASSSIPGDLLKENCQSHGSGPGARHRYHLLREGSPHRSWNSHCMQLCDSAVSAHRGCQALRKDRKNLSRCTAHHCTRCPVRVEGRVQGDRGLGE